ncbi:unnamed protein product [Ectocarpus sp. 12 AP-2014]
MLYNYNYLSLTTGSHTKQNSHKAAPTTQKRVIGQSFVYDAPLLTHDNPPPPQANRLGIVGMPRERSNDYGMRLHEYTSLQANRFSKQTLEKAAEKCCSMGCRELS